VRQFWSAAGAIEEEPAGGLDSGAWKREGRIGFVVLPAHADIEGRPWIGIRDNVHYSLSCCGEQLAEALHDLLKAPTFALAIGPKTRRLELGTSQYFGVARKSTKSWSKSVNEGDRFPHPFFTYASAASIEGASWLRFKFEPKVWRRAT
jgi:hypothetical protein